MERRAFEGTRAPFTNLIDYLEGGHRPGDCLRQFPAVSVAEPVQLLEEARESLLAELHEDPSGRVLPILRHHLPGHEVHTAEWAGLKGLTNGQLLDRAEQADTRF